MRVCLLLVVLLFCSVANSAPIKGVPMISGATGTGASATFGPSAAGEKTFQAIVSGSGSVSATVQIQVSNDPTNLGWITMGTITLSGTTSATDGFSSESGWRYFRANITAISGTSAAVTVIAGQE